MADVRRSDTFTFDRDEIAVLLKLVGRVSPKEIEEMGLSTEAHMRLYDVLGLAGYAPMFSEAP